MSKVTSTSIAAFRTSPIRPLRDRVLMVIEAFGPHGCITDQVIEQFALSEKANTGKITGRFSELIDEGMMFRAGDTRKGVSGKQQLVMRHIKYAPLHPLLSPKAKKNPFFEGVKFAAKVMIKADPTLKGSPAALALRSELRKLARRAI